MPARSERKPYEPRRYCLHLVGWTYRGWYQCRAHVFATHDPDVVYCGLCGRYSPVAWTEAVDRPRPMATLYERASALVKWAEPKEKIA
ncbi:MAG: hypothetical protein H0U69_03530 [Trueperaceae bacterium]|nr:hypothetical protein [Trueperaceae bacterium]